MCLVFDLPFSWPLLSTFNPLFLLSLWACLQASSPQQEWQFGVRRGSFWWRGVRGSEFVQSRTCGVRQTWTVSANPWLLRACAASLQQRRGWWVALRVLWQYQSWTLLSKHLLLVYLPVKITGSNIVVFCILTLYFR